jgi:hypothetical protein
MIVLYDFKMIGFICNKTLHVLVESTNVVIYEFDYIEESMENVISFENSSIQIDGQRLEIPFNV